MVLPMIGIWIPVEAALLGVRVDYSEATAVS
jgi:hypothetical protein